MVKVELGLMVDTLVKDFAVMDKKPKGISKRLQVEDSQPTIDQPQAKRQRGVNCVFSLPSSPASSSVVLDQDSTSPPDEMATTPKLVIQKHSFNPSQLWYRAEFVQIMKIQAPPEYDCDGFFVHEHLLRPLSRLIREFRPKYQRQRLKWDCLNNWLPIPIGPQTIQFFIHWLYHNSLVSTKSANRQDLNTEDIDDHQLRTKTQRMQEICPQYSVAACQAALEKKRFNHNDAPEYLAHTIVQDTVCGFSQLLDLYIFASNYEIIIFKNVIIDHLIEEASYHDVPPGWSTKIYQHTKSGDQLRRLWVDFYVWRVNDEQLDVEQREDSLDSTFLKDLVRAQARELHDKKVSEDAPFDKDSTAYHVRDEATGQYCCRTQFEGDKYQHRGEFLREQLEMQNAHAKVEELERKNSELRKALRAQNDQGTRMSSQKRGSEVLPGGTRLSSNGR